MHFDPQAGITDLADREYGRRRRGRLGQEAVISNVGQVLDLSPTGMRVRTSKVPKGRFTAHLVGLGIELDVDAHAVWERRSGFLRREVGIEFIDVSESTLAQITRLAMLNRKRLSV